MTAVATSRAKTERPVRRRRRRLSDRLTVAHVVPVVLGVLVFVLVLGVFRDRSRMVLVPVAAAEIKAGDPVTVTNIKMVNVHAQDAAVRGGFVDPKSLAAGREVASILIHAGDPITRSEIAQPAAGPGLGSMSVQVPVEHANGGALVAGDKVDVIGQKGGQSEYVARGLQVLAVPSTGGSSGLSRSSTGYYVVVATDGPTALRLAQAINSRGGGSSIDVIRTTGVAGDQMTPPTSPTPTAAPAALAKAGTL